MYSFLNKVLTKVADQYAALEQTYSHDIDEHFRAQNLLSILIALLAIFVLFLAFFMISQEKFIDNRAKLVFGPPLFALWLVMFGCFKLVKSGKFRLARNIFLSVSSVAVWAAISVTGGFPNAIALPAVFIPIVFFYCLIGGRSSTWLSLAYAGSLGLLGVIEHSTGIGLPNYTSSTNPFVNAAVVYMTAIAVLIMAFISFDVSVRTFSRRSQAAVESKSQFLANMSHEIRTPMNGVIGLSQLLAQTPLSETQDKYVTAIQTSGEALLTIINDILDFSKIEAGKLELDIAPFDLEAVINDIGLLLSSKIEEKDIEFTVRYAPDLPRNFQGDDGRIRQILLNLVGNAVKFTENGSVKVQVLRSASGKTRIEVLDTGIGIDDAHIGSIFDKFSQAESSTTRTFGGTGLGLAISQRLVQLMGGKIGVTSTLGTGSTFWFEVPLPEIKASGPDGKDRRAERPARRAADKRDAPVTVTAPEPETASDLLFVSNSKATINSNRNVLEKTEYSTKYMSFSKALVEHMNTLVHGGHPLPILILDTRNITQSAKIFLEKISRHKQFSKMPVIALIDPNDADMFESTKNAKMVTRLEFPVAKGEILLKISKFSQSAAIDRAAGTVPAMQNEEPAPTPSAPPRRAASKNLQVLVAEDNRINMKVLQNIMSTEDYDVTYAYSGQQVIDFCQTAIFDIIVLDMAMPVMSGTETGKAIRTIEAEFGLAETPIIGLKPPLGADTQINYEVAGLTDYLPNPVRKDDLLAYISLYTEQSAPNSEALKTG